MTLQNTKMAEVEVAAITLTDPYHYRSKMSNELQNIKSLKKIINSISELDFPILYRESLNETDICEYILKLRTDIKKESDMDKKNAIQKNIRRYEPNMEKKVLITTRRILQIAEEFGIGLGFNSLFTYLYDPEEGFWESTDLEVLECFLTEAAQKAGIFKYDAELPKNKKRLYDQFTFLAAIPEPKINENEVRINLRNGTFVVGKETMELRPFDCRDFFKYRLPFDFDPEAEAPIFKKYLEQVMPEKEAQNVLSEYIGYVFARNLKLEKCLVLVGNGANGKSVFYEIVEALLGRHNIKTFPLNQLTDANGYYRAELTNVLLNYSSELGGKNIDFDLAKQLISNEPVSARSPYGKPFILTDYCRFMFNTNLIPKNLEQSNGFFRRFMFLDFDITIPPKEQDVDLSKKIIESELSGVFNWVIEGLKRLLKKKAFTVSPKIVSATKRIMTESNSVASFMDNFNYVPSTTDSHDSVVLYEKYENYCTKSGIYKSTRIEFLRRLEMFGYYVKRKATNNATLIFCEENDGRSKPSFAMDVVATLKVN